MRYTKGQLETLWATVNPGNGNPHLMAAIALAESAGEEKAENSIGACGLWQIHPYQEGCLNAVTNARMAGEKLRTQGLGAWETYTNGAYKQFYTGIATPEPVPTGTATTKNASLLSPVEGGVSLIEKFAKLFEFFTTEAGWLRIGKVGLGLLLLLVGTLGMANIDFHPVTVANKVGEAAAVAA